ncbi:neurogenic locus notch homolog protein 3-like [Physella acuta]|uniref:neurogenic locus notch homolog protein 3-like n=1 Tax=Physella acuta TaxID=109671 RepID=UPI0027DD4AE3|nr:neurogenic locus notch homolog protein 3-like [Physella acuta]
MVSRDPCQSFTCLNGGSCTAPADAPSCICKPGFFGSKCEYNRDPCYNFNCTNGGHCTAPADAPYCVCPSGYTGTKCQTKTSTSTGGCPVIEPGSFGVCGGQFCSADSECPSGQICCASACGGKLCTPGTPSNGAVCPGGCPKGYTCEFKSPPCKPGFACIQIVVPTCVPPKDECGGCPDGQECVDTGIRCFTTPCPTYQCRPKKVVDQCGGCAAGEECVDTGIRCITTPCPTYQCVRKTTPKPTPVCNKNCIKGYKCVVRVPTCDPFSSAKCSTTPVAQCVPDTPVLASCPKPANILDPMSRACRRFVLTCRRDSDCNRNQRCCPNSCNKRVCTTVPRLQ